MFFGAGDDGVGVAAGGGEEGGAPGCYVVVGDVLVVCEAVKRLGKVRTMCCL